MKTAKKQKKSSATTGESPKTNASNRPERHSMLGPSSLERRALCPGSYEMEKGKPDDPSEAAEEGTFYHGLVADVLAGDKSAEDALKEAGDARDTVQGALNFAAWKRSKNPNAKQIVEEELNLSSIHPLIEFGTGDLLFIEFFSHGDVIDWKWTRIDPPPAPQNLQLAALAVGASNIWELSRVTASLYLAHSGFVSSYTFDADALARAQDRLRQIAEAAATPFAPLIPSKSACRYCRARMSCPALLSTLGEAGKAFVGAVDDIGPHEVSRLIKLSEPLRDYVKALERKAFGLLMAGADVPDFALVEGRAHRVWVEDEAKMIETLKKIAEEVEKDASEITETKIKTPAKVEKAWGKSKAVTKALSPYITKPRGQMKLQRTDSGSGETTETEEGE